MMEHYEDHHQGLLMPDQLKVSDQEASASIQAFQRATAYD